MYAYANVPTCSCTLILLVHACTHIIQQMLLLRHQEKKDVKAKCTIHCLVGDCGTGECGWLKGFVPCVPDTSSSPIPSLHYLNYFQHT